MSNPFPLRAFPVDAAIHRKAEQQRVEVRMRDGWARAYARQNQLLPYAGTSLTPGEVLRLAALLDDACFGSPREQDVGPALLSAVMTTGRSVAALATIGIEEHRPGERPSSGPLLVLGDQWTWWLPPGGPDSPQLRDRGSPVQTVSRPTLMPFPCSTRTRLLLEKRGIPDRIGERLFPSSAAALMKALRLTMRKAGVAAPPVMAERWLFHRLANMPDGDIAIASIVTGYQPVLARTVIRYTMLDGGSLPDWLAAALTGFDRIDITGVRREEVDLGSRYAPSLADTQALATRLGS